MSPSGLFFPASVGDTLVAVTQWDQDSPMAPCQEKSLRPLCSPTTHPRHSSTLGSPSWCLFCHPLTPSQEHPASPSSPSSCPYLSIILFIHPASPSSPSSCPCLPAELTQCLVTGKCPSAAGPSHPASPPTRGCSGSGCTGEIQGGLPDQRVDSARCFWHHRVV